MPSLPGKDLMLSIPGKDLVVIDNPAADRRYLVDIHTPEFTCLCPMTGQPDFAFINISYEPAAKIVELKSVKLYLWSFRDQGHYHESVINRIMDDLVAVLQPHWLRIEGIFNVRGGITTTVSADYTAPDELGAPEGSTA